MKKIVIITGQTATGKTKLAFELAQKHNGEIINCDSRQIYKKLDIITGKDIPPDQFHLENKVNNFDIGYYKMATLLHGYMAKNTKQFNHLTVQPFSYIPLWLYDIVSPNQYFSSFDYKTCALPVIKKLLKENKTPILVGGTYFYLKHLLYGVETENIPPNQELRKELNKKPVQELQQILQKLSVQSFNRLNNSDINNPQRLIRRIEIVKFNACHPDQRGGIPFEKEKGISPPSTKSRSRNDKMFIDKYAVEPSRLRSEARYNPVPGEAGKPTRLINGLNVTFLGLRYKNKDDLKKAIIKRVEKRLKQGAIDEVKNLLNNGCTENDPGLKTIGYVQIIKYLKGDIAKEKAIEEWITREIQYAKRQYTFMKKDPNIKWKEINS